MSGGRKVTTETRLKDNKMATSRKWREVRGELVETGKLDDGGVKARANKLRAQVRMYRLAEIRESLGISQQVLAASMGVSQARVSQIERGELEHTELATLRRYLHELGVEVEVSVRLGDDRLQIA